MQEQNWLLRLENISAGYNGDTVLSDVSIEIRENDFMGVIGPNGGGKTTLLKVILGLISPFSGKLIFNQGLITPYNIGYLPQMSEGDISFPVSVRDIILSGLMQSRGAMARMKNTDRELSGTVMKDLGIWHLRNRCLSELSGGELQRVYLGSALIGEPRLLLLDEPGNFVDSSFEQGFYDKLRELNRKMAGVMVSHDDGTISAYVKSFACVNGNLHYHDSGKITNDQLKGYGCPIQLIAHGDVPHTVLQKHTDVDINI